MKSCDGCPARSELAQMGISVEGHDRVIALAGNPNTGKSSIFNALTGLRQHTGNWPGKTVARAEGAFAYAGVRYKIVDLPGTYSLLSASQDEEIARDFILFGRPDATIVVTDATALERNLNLALQVLEITDKVVLCVNLMDEARRKGVEVDLRGLARDLGIPVVGTVARTREGLGDLLRSVAGVISGEIRTSPRRAEPPPGLSRAIEEILPLLDAVSPGLPSARWVAYRLLEGDHHVRQALLSGEIALLASGGGTGTGSRGPREADEGGAGT
jgi:ferrous iron transport protein B